MLAAALQALGDSDAPEDAEDAQSLAELRSAADKLRLAVGMDRETFFAHFQREDRRQRRERQRQQRRGN